MEIIDFESDQFLLDELHISHVSHPLLLPPQFLCPYRLCIDAHVLFLQMSFFLLLSLLSLEGEREESGVRHMWSHNTLNVGVHL